MLPVRTLAALSKVITRGVQLHNLHELGIPNSNASGDISYDLCVEYNNYIVVPSNNGCLADTGQCYPDKVNYHNSIISFVL